MTETTPQQGYLLPDPSTKLNIDVHRLIATFLAIDAHVGGLFAALNAKANSTHTHSIAAITGLADALTAKLDAGHHDALGDLSDVEVAGVANGMALMRQASKWIPVLLQINNISGLESALNSKASAAALEEIEASLDGLPSPASLLPSTSAVVATDFNTLVSPGWHSGLVLGTSPNGWGSAEYGYLLVAGHAGTSVTQFVLPHVGGRIRYRDRFEGSWSTWKTIGQQTVSAAAPSGGVNGDVWYQV